MILECWFYMFRGIYRHLIKAQEEIYSRFVENVKLVKPTFSARRADTRTTAWAFATCLLFENLLPVASYSRCVSDLKVPITAERAAIIFVYSIAWYCTAVFLTLKKGHKPETFVFFNKNWHFSIFFTEYHFISYSECVRHNWPFLC